MRRDAIIYPIILLSILFSAPAYAEKYDQDSPTDLFCEPGKTAGNNPAFGGKPVSLVSGMETFAPSTDLTLGNLFPIRVTRSYNSVTTYDSPLGYGWAINYDKRLYTYPDGSVTVRRECGGKKRFTFLSPSGYVGQTGDTGTLVQNEDGTFLYTDKNGESEKYDSQGRLMSMADAKGNSLAFSYRASTRDFLWGLLPANINQSSSLIVAYDYHLSKIEEKNAAGNLTGSSVDLHYDAASGRLTDLADSIGRTVTYTHDGIGNLTAVSGPSVNSTYGYTDPTGSHLLTSIDEGNGAYLNTYDSTGRVMKQTHGTGEIDFAYTIPYQKTTQTTLIKDSSGNILNTQTKIVEFDANRIPIKVTDTNGNITSYVRDSNSWIFQKSIKDIVTDITTTTAYTYDAKGNELTRTDAQGTAIEKTTLYTYHPVYNGVLTETVMSVVDPAQDRTTTNTYDDANGNLLTTMEQGLLGNGTSYIYTTTYTYDTNGKIATIDGPRTDVSDITTYVYDSTTGYLTSMTQPIIGTTTYANFDPLGNPQTVTDPNGNATIYTYDLNGRVQTVKAPGDTAATQYFYLSGGCSSCGGANKIDHITLPEGNTIWYTYDTMGNLSSIKDSANNSSNYTYDSAGNKVTEQIKDPSSVLQKALSYQYDALNRLSKIVNPDNTFTQYGYDARGNRTSLQTPNSAISTYSYDALSRLVSVIQPGTVTTSYGYNSNNNLSTVTDANNNVTTYKYDDKGRVFQVISPDIGTTTYAYDPAGNLTSKTDAKGITISYVYDALNRLTNISADSGIVYTYDACVNGKGRLCSMTDASGTTAYEYTPKGQVKKETKTIDSYQYITQYTYDQNGNLKTMTYPSGRVITYNLSNDKVTSVLNNAANVATNIQYKPFGGVSSLSYGNGIAGGIGYDNQYRIVSMTTGTFLNLTYIDDANGNITGITNNLDATKNKSYGYDALDRLMSTTGSWGSLGWTYDGVGNRQTENTNTYAYYSNTNKLSSASGRSFGYDNNGNTTTENARQYTFNQNQRLIQVVDGAMNAGYTYNGNGQRVKKIVNGTPTVYHYNISGQLIAESNSAGNVAAEYVYLNGQPLAKMEGANTYHYHNDHLGTPQKMTDGSGQVVWSADYKPFGEATIIISTITNNLRFPGQYFDVETGLHQNGFRDYNPPRGGYIEADPVGLRGGNNLFSYVHNNPVIFIDPRGLAGIGGGYYYGGGAEISYSSSICCENKALFDVKILTVCGGVGLGIKGTIPIGGSIGGVSSKGGCPKTRYYYKHETVFFAVSTNVQGDSQGISAGIDVGINDGISTTWVFCSDTVFKTKTGCCKD